MIEFLGEKKLSINTGQRKEAVAKQIAYNIYALQYFGSSNATLIIGDKGCILVEAF